MIFYFMSERVGLLQCFYTSSSRNIHKKATAVRMLSKKVFSQQNSIVALLIVIEAASHKHALSKLISILLRIISNQRLLCSDISKNLGPKM